MAGRRIARARYSTDNAVRLLTVLGSATKKLKSVAFYDGKRRIATDKSGAFGLFTADWRTGKAKKGKHVLRAVLTAGAKHTSAQRAVRVCR